MPGEAAVGTAPRARSLAAMTAPPSTLRPPAKALVPSRRRAPTVVLVRPPAGPLREPRFRIVPAWALKTTCWPVPTALPAKSTSAPFTLTTPSPEPARRTMLPPMVTTPPLRFRFALAATPLPPLPRFTPAEPMVTTPPPMVKSDVTEPPETLPTDIVREAILATPVSKRKSAVAGPTRLAEVPRTRASMLRSA